ncbi:MAG: MFS transporter [Pseudomonadales bacterium]|nr:MFS transporter [Pseudomonadales bacterium]
MKPTNTWVLYLAMLSVGMGQTVIFAVMPMLGRELALDQIIFYLPFGIELQPKELTITALSALTALTFSLISPLWGRLSDSVGRKPIIIIGLLGYTLGVSLFNMAAYAGLTAALTGVVLYLVLILTRVIHASVMSAAFPAASAYMVDITPAHSRTQGLSKLSASMQMGVMLGPILAYLVVFSYLMPFIVQGIITFCAAIMVFLFLPSHQPKNKAIADHKPAKLRFFDDRYRFFLLQALAVYICMGMVQQTLGFYFQDVLSITGTEAAKRYSLSMIVSSAAMLFAQLVLVQRLSLKPQQFIFLGLPFFVLGFLLLALASNAMMLYGGMGLFGFAMGCCGPSLSAAASLTVDDHEQGALAGLIGSVAGMGFVIGPLFGGFLYALNSSYPFLCATLIAAALFLTINIQRIRS